MVGERKVSFWKKGDRIKEKIGGKKRKRFFFKKSMDSTWKKKEGLVARIRNRGRRKTGIHHFFLGFSKKNHSTEAK